MPCLVGDAPHKFLFVARILQINLQELEATGHEVDMVIDETGYDQPTLEVDHPGRGTRIGLHLAARPHRQDAPVRHRHRFNERCGNGFLARLRVGLASPDLAVKQNQAGRVQTLIGGGGLEPSTPRRSTRGAGRMALELRWNHKHQYSKPNKKRLTQAVLHPALFEFSTGMTTAAMSDN